MLIVIIALSFSSLVSARTCQGLFTDAVNIGNIGRRDSNNANSLLTMMKDQARANASDSVMCELGRDSRMNAYRSAVNFRKAIKIWLAAVSACEAPGHEIAAEQADLYMHYYNSQAEFIAGMDSLLGAKCGFQPITPVLN